MPWIFLLGLGSAITGVVVYIVAMRLPRASGLPLLVFATLFGTVGAAILLAYVVYYFALRALGFVR